MPRHGAAGPVREWHLVFTHISATQAGRIDSSASQGVMPFLWTPPGGASGRYLCGGWQITPAPSGLASLRAIFTETEADVDALITPVPTPSQPSAITRAEVRGTKLSGLVTLFRIDMEGNTSGFSPVEAQVMPPAGGESYAAYPLAAKGSPEYRRSAGASADQAFDLSRLFNSLVDGDELRGREVRRIITLADQLDPPHGTGGGACFPPERWIIERIARLDHRVLRLELAAGGQPREQAVFERVMLRDRANTAIADGTRHVAGSILPMTSCPYTADRYFTADGQPTAQPSRIAVPCRSPPAAAPHTGPLPFVGFPGLTRL